MERLRFDNRFQLHLHVDEKLNRETIVIPSMLIQPYVENAIWHGLLHKDSEGKLTINFNFISTQQLEVIIEDDGIGRDKAMELKSKQLLKKKSYGIKITEHRIALINRINGITASSTIEDLKSADGKPAGTKVTLVISLAQRNLHNN